MVGFPSVIDQKLLLGGFTIFGVLFFGILLEFLLYGCRRSAEFVLKNLINQGVEVTPFAFRAVSLLSISFLARFRQHRKI